MKPERSTRDLGAYCICEGLDPAAALLGRFTAGLGCGGSSSIPAPLPATIRSGTGCLRVDSGRERVMSGLD